MRTLSPEVLQKIMLCKYDRASEFAEYIDSAMVKYQIDELSDRHFFLAQIGHESGGLVYTEEIASGEAYDTGAKALALGNTPADDDDGRLYKGHGLIQVTGAENHKRYAAWLEMAMPDCLAYLQTPEGAADVAGWFWFTRSLSRFGRVGTYDAFVECTRRVNGGLNGLQDRIDYLRRAQSYYTP